MAENRLQALLKEADRRTELEEEAKARGLIPTTIGEDIGIGLTSMGAGFNRGVSQMLGFPGDVANVGANLIRGGMGQQPLPTQTGSAGVQSALTGIGATFPGTPEMRAGQAALGVPRGADVGTRLGRVATRTGEELGGVAAIAPAGAATKAFRAAPGAVTATEAGLGLLGGAGAGFAGELVPGGGPVADIAGQVVGGVGIPSAAQGAVRGFQATQRTLGAAAGKQKALERGAGEALQAISEDPNAVAAAIDQRLSQMQAGQTITEPTVGQISGDPGLASLERSLDIGATTPENIDALNRSISGISEGRPEAASEFFRSRIADINAVVDARVANAVQNAQRRLQSARPNMSRDEAGIALNQAVTNALDDLKGQERALYQAIGTNEVNTTAVKDAAARIINDRRPTDAGEDFDPIIFEVAGGQRVETAPSNIMDRFGNPMTSDQVINESVLDDVDDFENIRRLRTRILDNIRAERAKGPSGNRRRIRNLNILLEGVFDSLTPANVSDPASLEAFDKARAFSRRINEKSANPPISTILGTSVGGGQRVAPELTARRAAPEGQQAGVGARAVREFMSLAQSNAADDPLAGLILNDFAERSGINVQGKVNPEAAKTYMSNNRELLAEFPQVREDLRGAVAAQEAADMGDMRSVALRNYVAESQAARFLNGEPRIEIRRAFNSRSPVNNVNSLVRSAKRDPTGAALDGLRRAYTEDILERVFPREGRINAALLERTVKKDSKGIQILFGSDGFRRWKKLVNESRLATRSVRGSTGSPTFQNASVFVSALGQIAGARVGAQIGTTPLISAGIGRRIANRLVNESSKDNIKQIMKDALQNPATFEALTSRVRKTNADAINARLNLFLFNVGPAAVEPPID